MLGLSAWLRRTGRSHQRPLGKRVKLWLEPLENRTLLSSSSGLDPAAQAAMRTNMVGGLYQVLLGRTPASSEVSGWVNDLQNGLTAVGLADGFLGSSEYGSDIVREHYLQLLGRQPESGITTSWLGLLQSAGGFEPMTIGVLASAEYYAKSGGAGQQWVTALYRDVLGRQPDPAGWSHWLAQLQAGATSQSIAADFVNSQEAHLLAVQDAYQALL